MEPHAPIEIRIEAQMGYVCAVRATVGAIAEKFEIPKALSSKLVLAVEEAMTNVIRHGYHGSCCSPILVRLAPIKRGDVPGIEVTIEDETQGVDLSKIKSRPLDEYRPGGLGVHIIRSFMDEVEYSHLPGGKGVRLRMVKLAIDKKCDGEEGGDAACSSCGNAK